MQQHDEMYSISSSWSIISTNRSALFTKWPVRHLPVCVYFSVSCCMVVWWRWDDVWIIGYCALAACSSTSSHMFISLFSDTTTTTAAIIVALNSPSIIHAQERKREKNTWSSMQSVLSLLAAVFMYIIHCIDNIFNCALFSYELWAQFISSHCDWLIHVCVVMMTTTIFIFIMIKKNI